MKKMMSNVVHHIPLLRKIDDFHTFYEDGPGLICHANEGKVEVSVLQGECEYQCKEICEQAILIKLLHVSKEHRNKGHGRRLFGKVVDAFKDTDACLVLYAYGVEISGSSCQPEVVDDAEIQKRLVNYYLGFDFRVLCLGFDFTF